MKNMLLALILAVPPRAAAQDQGDLKRNFAKTVEEYVAAQSQATAGSFVVHDDVLNKDWRLKLIRIHKDKIARLGQERFFACADFKDKLNTVDLDFYVNKTDSGWLVEKILVHKVNGRPRYTYNSKNEMVPVPTKKKLAPMSFEQPQQSPEQAQQQAQQQAQSQAQQIQQQIMQQMQSQPPAQQAPEPASQPAPQPQPAQEHPREHPH